MHDTKGQVMKTADFWWLPKHLDPMSPRVGVGHHKPLTDDDEPSNIKWFHSLKNQRLSSKGKYYPLSFIHEWRKACNDINVYRTLTLFNEEGEPILLGPFQIDIDNSDWVNGYREGLPDALNVTRVAANILTSSYKLPIEQVRIFFTGRKGFNIEVCPEALRISGSLDDQIRLSAKKLEEVIAALRQANRVSSNSTNAVSNGGTIVDRIYGNRFSGYRLKHPYIRLHRSINKWVRRDGMEIARRKIELSLNELANLTVEQICKSAESP